MTLSPETIAWAAERRLQVEHCPGSGAVFSACGTYRYLLTRQWDTTEHAVFLMLNPSTAGVLDDATIRRCKTFARRNGYGGLTVANLFALRARERAELHRHPAPVGDHNNAALQHLVRRPGTRVIAAWGTSGGLFGRDAEVTALVTAHGARLHCLGTTQHGFPRHPLYLPDRTPLVAYTARESR